MKDTSPSASPPETVSARAAVSEQTSPQTAPQMSLAVWGMLILLSLIWGASFLFGRIAVLEIPPLTLVSLRVGLAAVALNLYLLFYPSPVAHDGRLWRNFAVMGFFNNIIPFTLIFYGQQEIGAGLAAIINSMTPVWTLLMAHFTTSDERLAANKIIGIILGFAGVAVLIGPDAVTGLSASGIAQLAVLGATVSYGIASVFGRRFSQTPPVQTARGQLTMSALMMLPLALLADRPWTLTMPGNGALLATLLLALICTAFAYILFFKILARAGAVNVALVTFLIPPSAILMGIVFLGEKPEFLQLCGAVLIICGLIVIDGRLLKHGVGKHRSRDG